MKNLFKYILISLAILFVVWVPDVFAKSIAGLGVGLLFNNVDEIMAFRKANGEFVANTTGITDLTTRTGGQVLEAVNIDSTMILLAQTADTYNFLNTLFMKDIKSTMVFYNRLLDYGDNENGSFVGEMDDADFKKPTLEQISSYVSFLAEGYASSKVMAMVETLPGNDQETVQQTAAINRIMKTLSRANFVGNRTLNPLEYNGLQTELVAAGRVHDAEGAIPAISLFKDIIVDININNGLVNEAWMHNAVKQTLDNYFVGAKEFVIPTMINPQTGKPFMGYDIPGIRGTDLKDDQLLFKKDRYIDRHSYPLPMVRNASNVLVEGKTHTKAPDSPTLTSVLISVSTVVGSKWKAADILNAAGVAATVKYRIVAKNRYGRSQACAAVVSDAVAAVGKVFNLTITHALTGEAGTEFEIFRETLPGSGDYRFVQRIAQAVGATTTYQDLNEWRPGCSEIFIGDFNSRSESSEQRTLQMLRLLPLLQTKFSPSATYQRKLAGMVEFYGGLAVLAPRKFYMIKNVPTKV